MTNEVDGGILLLTSSQEKNVLLISRDLIFLKGDSWPSGKVISSDENRFPLLMTLLVIYREAWLMVVYPILNTLRFGNPEQICATL